MREALRAELGALAAYHGLAERTADRDLARLLERFHDEEREQVERLRGVMCALGARPRRRSLRRAVAARLLVGSRHLFGTRFVLRVCQDAEATVSRWYREHALFLLRTGEIAEARACEELSQVKAQHARVLTVWVEHFGSHR